MLKDVSLLEKTLQRRPGFQHESIKLFLHRVDYPEITGFPMTGEKMLIFNYKY